MPSSLLVFSDHLPPKCPLRPTLFILSRTTVHIVDGFSRRSSKHRSALHRLIRELLPTTYALYTLHTSHSPPPPPPIRQLLPGADYSLCLLSWTMYVTRSTQTSRYRILSCHFIWWTAKWHSDVTTVLRSKYDKMLHVSNMWHINKCGKARPQHVLCSVRVKDPQPRERTLFITNYHIIPSKYTSLPYFNYLLFTPPRFDLPSSSRYTIYQVITAYGHCIHWSVQMTQLRV